MRNLLLPTLLISGLLASHQLEAKKLSFKRLNQLREYITTVGSKSLVGGALILTLAGTPTAIADNHDGAVQEQVAAEELEIPAWQQQEVMHNDYEWEKQIFYFLVDKGDERLAFHFVYIGQKDDHSLFVGRQRPYGTHVLDNHTEGLATSLVGYRGEVAYNIDLIEVASFYDTIDGIVNLSVFSIKGLDMSEYKPATLEALPSHSEESLRAFTYRPEPHPLLTPEEANDQFMLRLLTRECKIVPNKFPDKTRLALHTCGAKDFAVGGLMFLQSTGALVGYHSGWVDELGIVVGMGDNLVSFGDWAVAAAPSLQRNMATTWGAIKSRE